MGLVQVDAQMVPDKQSKLLPKTVLLEEGWANLLLIHNKIKEVRVYIKNVILAIGHCWTF